MRLSGLHPAKVVEYDHLTRLCLVDIEGISTGGDDFLQAEIMYSIGDKSHNTEVEILPDDLVWVRFHGGDPRYPIIVGYRTLNEGASTDNRRFWRNKNIKIEVDEEFLLYVGEEQEKSKILVNQERVMLRWGAADGQKSTVHVTENDIRVQRKFDEDFISKLWMSNDEILATIGDEQGTELQLTPDHFTVKTGGDDKGYMKMTDSKIEATMGNAGGAIIEATAQKISAKLGTAELSIENNKLWLKIGSNEILLTNALAKIASGASSLTLTPTDTKLVTPAFDATQT
jgi:hypothetical protein